MTLKLYCDLLSQPSRALYVFFKTCNIPFEMKRVNLAKMEHLTPEYQQIHPFQKVPAIQHDGFNLIESVAIFRYICREYKVADHWYPADSKQRAKVDEFLEWQHHNTRAHCALYIRGKFLYPILTGKQHPPEKLAKLKKNMEETLDILENVWLKNKPYLIGSEITVADLLAVCEVEQVRLGGYEPGQNRPRLAKWMERIVKDTSPYYQEANVFLNKIASRNKEKEQPASML